MKKWYTRKSFTFVEMLIVLVIIAILSSQLYSIYIKQRQQLNLEEKLIELKECKKGKYYHCRNLTEETLNQKIKKLEKELENLQNNQK